MKRVQNIAIVLLSIFLLTTITGCATYKHSHNKPGYNPDTTSIDTNIYSIRFDKSTGKIVLKDSAGNIIPGRRVNFPEEHLPVTAIINHHSIIEAEGSCLIIVNGYVFNQCLH